MGFFLMQLSGCQWIKSEGGAGFLGMCSGVCYLPANLSASHSHANLYEKPQNKEEALSARQLILMEAELIIPVGKNNCRAELPASQEGF